MIRGRRVRRFALWALAAAVVAMVEVGPASAQVLLGQVDFSHAGTVCTSETGGGQVPSISVIFGIGHGPIDPGAVGSSVPFGPLQTGTVDFNAGNSAKFPQLVQGITNGIDQTLFTQVTLQTQTTSVGVSSTRLESALPELNGAPDLVGTQVSFVRLVVTDSIIAVQSCPPGQSGARSLVAGRWEFWGTDPTPPPTLELTALGCTACHVGDFAQFKLVIVNPGPARTVEVKVGIRFPDGSTIVNLLDHHAEQALGAGAAHEVPLPSITVPGGIPFGTYILEAAVLEPQLGTSLARETFPAQLVP